MNAAALSPRERELKDRLEVAEETIRQLRALPGRESLKAYRYLRFTPTEACILKLLSSATVHRTEELRVWLDFANYREGGCRPASVYVAVWRLRCKLKRAVDEHNLPPMSIDTAHGHGFGMSARSIANLRALLIEEGV